MKCLLICLAILSPLIAFGNSVSSLDSILKLSNQVLNNSKVPFISHQASGSADRALAMNISYQPIKIFRDDLESRLGYKLKTFKGWNANGEAHITTISPVEFNRVFSTYVSFQEIDEIALNQHIQASDLHIEGVGRGIRVIDGRPEETYFIIVKSERLLKIRREIYRLYLSRGGTPKSWDPEHFYPHITVGYTLRDLHEADGIIKDKEHSLDRRFTLELEAK